MCFLFASSRALFRLVRVFLRLCLRILFAICLPFSLCLKLRYSGSEPVYFSTCLFVMQVSMIVLLNEMKCREVIKIIFNSDSYEIVC